MAVGTFHTVGRRYARVGLSPVHKIIDTSIDRISHSR